MTTDTYNGWTNYSTWNAHLWMTNEEWAYDTIRLRRKELGRAFKPGDARCLFAECFPEGTPDMKGRIPKNISWREIADAFNECCE